ncbi:MAG: M14 family metallopeptidase [Gemmatimonadota bacterium]|nr:M14 family metallopeptidase [Gemmatimonadota bacterium]
MAGAAVALAVALAPASAVAQDLTAPEAFFGHQIGADYELPNYTQLTEYWTLLSTQSDRMTLRSIGKTAEGRDQLMAIVTSPENHENLRRYRDISARLANAEGVTEEEARQLAREGKAVVWIDGGLHATEVLGAQQLMETLWQMVSGTDDETLRILDDVVILFVHANPDGMELVSNWYTRVDEKTERSTGGIPRLYQKYVGHDNNRDFYASTQPETENMNRVMYREWYPQIVYNHHQTGPTGTVLFAPPFRDPFNYNIDPLVITGIDLVGSAMHSRFVAEGKPGATRRRGANYSTWWNGGLRTTPYFKNMIGLLTETIGNPTPMEIPMIMERIVPSDGLPAPIEPQPWHFRQSVDYSVTANKAVLDLASRYRETFLYRIWRMGMNSIERGSEDHWTIHPKMVDQLAERMNAERGNTDFAQNVGGFGGIRGSRDDYETMFTPETRDPRGYILPADQPDFPTATKLVNALLEGGVHVHRATADFSVAGTRYPAGSYVVKSAQAFRPHVLDMFEPQDHPNDFQYPGAPPTPPYDNAGWTLAMQMGVEYDRILEGFDGPFERIEEWNATPLAGTVAGADGASGFLFSHAANDAFAAINRLQANDHEVYWLREPFTAGGMTHPSGTFYVKTRGGTAQLLGTIATELGIDFTGTADEPAGEALRLRAPRVALWDEYGGSMPSGWIRWILEQFEYRDVEVVYPPRFDEGNLSDDYDIIIFPNGALGGDFEDLMAAADEDEDDDEGPGGFFRGRGPDPETVPEEYRSRMGRMSAAAHGAAIQEFLADGGSIVTIGNATRLGRGLGLPLEDHLEDASREEYYVPGSILEVAIDEDALVTAGMTSPLMVSFNNSPVFKPMAASSQDSDRAGTVDPIAWFDQDRPLRSGWAWGQERLNGGVTMGQADVGEGTIYLFGPLITRRAQPHATFKLLFNAIALSNAESGRP